MNKNGQIISIVVFFAIIIATFIIAIILLKVVNTTLAPFGSAIGNVSATAGANVNYINTKFTSMWDWVIVFVFLINIIVLFVSAFMIDIHPAFLFLYIITIFLMFTFGTMALSSLEALYNLGTYANGSFNEQALAMPMVTFLVDNFAIVMLVIAVLSGVLMYAKIRFFSNQGSAGGY